MINPLTNAAAAVIRAVPALERPAFALLGLSDTRPFRSLRFRVFKRWAARLPDDQAVRTARLPGGLRLRVDVRDWCGITYVEPAAIEPATTGYLIENLRPGDVYLDVGGNVGYHALRAAARVGPAGKVHCFEPNPRLQGLIRESVRLNGFEGRLELHPVALSDADAELPLFISTDPSNSGL